MIHSQVAYANLLMEVSDEQLNFKVLPGSWSALECIEHLNLVLNFYVPEITARIVSSQALQSAFFKGTYIGNKFAKSMLPNEGVRNIKTKN